MNEIYLVIVGIKNKYDTSFESTYLVLVVIRKIVYNRYRYCIYYTCIYIGIGTLLNML